MDRARVGAAVARAAARRKTVLDADDDALNLLGAFAGVLGPQRGIAAGADQIADLAIQIADGIADQMRGLAGGLREALHFARDHRNASSRGARARGFTPCLAPPPLCLFPHPFPRAADLRHPPY